MHRRTRLGIVIAGLAAAAAFVIFHPALRNYDPMPPIPPSDTGSVSDATSAPDAPLNQPPPPPGQAYSVDDRLRQFGAIVRGRLEPDFKRAGISWPPASVALIGLKRERVLEVHAAGSDGKFRFILSYPILAASGTAGPKLREGDRQVPEGLYRIESLNPNSLFHLALRVNYPNEFDRSKAAAEGRSDPGCDIMIHGGAASIGCLAMGDGPPRTSLCSQRSPDCRISP